jgi:hypothetical protein
MTAHNTHKLTSVKGLMDGNLVYNRHGEVIAYDWLMYKNFSQPKMDNDYGFYAIPLTEERLVELEHTKKVHNESNVEYIYGRFSVWFIEGKLQVIKFGIQRLDHTIINTVHGYQNVVYALTGTELTTKLI